MAHPWHSYAPCLRALTRHLYARARLTTTLTNKSTNTGGQYTLWRTEYSTELLSVDAGGYDSLELGNGQG